MLDKPNDFGAKPDPLAPLPSDTRAGSQTDSIHDKTLEERLAYWDEWNELDRERLARDPRTGPALKHLQDVELWLQDALLEKQACPTPEQLFDFAGPLECQALTMAEREEIREHIAICPTCGPEVLSLATPPPAPLVWEAPGDTAQAAEPASESDEPPAAPILTPILGRSTSWGARPFLLTAASIALVWFLATRPKTPVVAAELWPTVEVLRGAPERALLYPRGAVLARGSELAAGVMSSGDRWNGAFEIAPDGAAQTYGVRLFAHDGSAFDKGTQVGNWEADVPTIPAGHALPPGHYTAEVWVIRSGLTVPIASSEFEVRSSAATLTHLQSLTGVERVRYLHSNGWISDARQEALRLPSTPARERFLSALDPE